MERALYRRRLPRHASHQWSLAIAVGDHDAAGERRAQQPLGERPDRPFRGEAGVSHNAPYKHFANMEALLAAVAARELLRRRDKLAATLARDEAPEAALRGAVALQAHLRAVDRRVGRSRPRRT